MDLITSNQLTKKNERCELDPNSKLELIVNPATIENKRRDQDIHLFQKGRINCCNSVVSQILS